METFVNVDKLFDYLNQSSLMARRELLGNNLNGREPFSFMMDLKYVIVNLILQLKDLNVIYVILFVY